MHIEDISKCDRITFYKGDVNVKLKKMLMVAVLVVVILSGCAKGINLKSIKEVSDAKLTKTELWTYLKTTSYKDRKDQQGIAINVNGTLTDDFAKLSDQEHFKLLMTAINSMKEETGRLDFLCGISSTCFYDTFNFKNGKDTYSMKINLDEDNLKLFENDKEIYTSSEYFHYNGEATNVNSITEDDTVTDSNFQIHQWMKEQYDKLTNYGNNYDPDRDDPKIAILAAEHFGISPEEAGKIYEDVEYYNANK